MGRSTSTVQSVFLDQTPDFTHITLGDGAVQLARLTISTTDATQTEMTRDGNAASASTRVLIVSDTTVGYRARIAARRTDADDESAYYELSGAIDNNAGTTALVGSPALTVFAEDDTDWAVTAAADDTNDSLQILVTGEASKTIQWTCALELTISSG